MKPSAKKSSILIAILIAALLAPSFAFAQSAKSPKKAAFLSILLPGLGERYAGGQKSVKFFFFTEGMFWTGLFAFKKLNATRENTYRTFATARAGATTTQRPNSFYDRLTSFDSIYDYNARLQYVEGDQTTPLLETPENFWEWDTRASRKQFQELRSKATWARTRSFLFVGALLFNRFASALNAANIAAKTLPTATIIPTSQGDIYAQLQVRF
jgi:hypothetical protein